MEKTDTLHTSAADGDPASEIFHMATADSSLPGIVMLVQESLWS